MRKNNLFRENRLVMFMGGPERPSDPLDDILGDTDLGSQSPEDVDRGRNAGKAALDRAEALAESREELEAKAADLINTNADFADNINTAQDKEARLGDNAADRKKGERALAAMYKYYPGDRPGGGGDMEMTQFDAARRVAAKNEDMWNEMGVTQDFDDPMNTVRRIARMGAEKVNKYLKMVQTQKQCSDEILRAYR